MTDDVRLRDVTEDDLPILFEHQQEPEANQMAAFPARDREAFAAHWTKILDDTTVAKKTILFNGQVAGNIVSFEQSGMPKVGYWIGKSYWGKGIATKALSEFLGHVKARPLYAHVAKHNVGSIRVLEKCGFTICGEDKDSGAGGEEIEEFILKLSLLACTFWPSIAVAESKTPSQAYLDYNAAVTKATALTEVLPYLSAEYRAMLESRPKEDHPVWLKRLKEGTVQDVKITNETITGNKCTLEGTGTSPRGNAMKGKIVLVKEESGWKVDSEAWAN